MCTSVVLAGSFSGVVDGSTVVIVSYETLRQDKEIFLFTQKQRRCGGGSKMSSSLVGPTLLTIPPVWSAVIADEAHIIRNPRAAVSKCLFAVPARCRIALTGTPIQNQVN